MKRLARRIIRDALARTGYEIRRKDGAGYPPDFTPEDIEDIEFVKPYTMSTDERMIVMMHAIRYLVANGIPGAFMECGVWKGGSSMLAARTLERAGDESRELFLFDTYEGMSEPTEEDVSLTGQSAVDDYKLVVDYTKVRIDEVRENVEKTGYPMEKVHFVKGKVEDTVPAQAPAEIALLRLDTDWYESTRHELVHLYPRLVSGGILIVDDYGHWMGAKKATDEYLQEQGLRLFLARMDYTGRIVAKP